MARAKEIYDPSSNAWYWIDADGTIARNKDMYLRSSGDKWVRYDQITGKMIKGLHYQNGAWYYFDKMTGAMAHGRAWVPDWNSYGYFDNITGRFTENKETAPSSTNTSPSSSFAADPEIRRGRYCK